ncbi:hypothetical protein BC833DRAFT_581700 [Globomyces pollinis-pini]|nr:hypothetical protein BC833DRAFT_581700 [Globomyces pollinis-pini]
MSTKKPLSIPLSLSIERFYCKEVLKGILHSIVFHRTVSATVPQENVISSLDIVSVKLSDPMIDQHIEEKVVEILSQVDLSATKQMQVAVHFYEKKHKKSWFSTVTSKEDDSRWEEWIITIHLSRATTEKEQIMAKANLIQSLQTLLMTISLESGVKRDHIPPILNSEPFPFDITLHNGNESSWGRLLTNFIPNSN